MTDKSKTDQKTRRLNTFERLYLLWDYLAKLILESFDDLYTLLVQMFGAVGASLVKGISFVLSWLIGTGTGESRNIFLTLFRIVIGLPIVLAVFVPVFIVILIAGSLATVFGLRNIVEYTLKEQIAAWACVFALIGMAPLFLSNYSLFKISLIFTYAVGVVGLDFLFGQCGIVSLAQSGFMLLGGYITTWLYNGTFGFQVPLIGSLIIGSLSMGLLGLLLGIPSLRVKDSYLVIITLAFTVAMPKFMKAPQMSNYSGLKEGGLQLNPVHVPAIFGSDVVYTYYLVAVICLLLFYFAYRINNHSQIGRGFKTMKCDQEVSMILGIPVVKYKLMAFVLSSIYAGFSGGLLTILTKFIHPDSYTITNSVNMVVGTIVGGQGSILGSLMGGVFLTYEIDLSQYIGSLIPRGESLSNVAFGIAMILFVLFAPRGVAGELTAWLKSKFHGSPVRGTYYTSPPPDYDYLDQRENSFTSDKEKS
jgi:branched-chain amino acid transport system permease protein